VIEELEEELEEMESARSRNRHPDDVSGVNVNAPPHLNTPYRRPTVEVTRQAGPAADDLTQRHKSITRARIVTKETGGANHKERLKARFTLPSLKQQQEEEEEQVYYSDTR